MPYKSRKFRKRRYGKAHRGFFKRRFAKKATRFRRIQRRLTGAAPSTLTMIGGNLNPYPSKLRTKLCVTGRFDSSVGASQTAKIEGNGMFNPSASFSGQPSYFDHFMSIYTIYQVLAARVVITFELRSAPGAVGNQMQVYITPSTASSITLGTYEQLKCAENTRHSYLLGHETSGTPATVFKFPRKTLTMYMKTSRMYPRKSYDESFTGDVGNNPAQPWSFFFGYVTDDAATLAAAGLKYHVSITYYCNFTRRKDFFGQDG